LSLRLRGARSNRDAIGALVKIRAAGREQWNRVTTAVGYASSSALAVHFGLGAAAAADGIEIRWPSGTVQRLGRTRADQAIEITEPD
jgi:hypothetical protein